MTMMNVLTFYNALPVNAITRLIRTQYAHQDFELTSS